MVEANDHCVLGLKGNEPEKTGKISCEYNWCVIGYVVPIVQSCEKCRAINCGSNCVNFPQSYRNELKINIEGHLGHLNPLVRCVGVAKRGAPDINNWMMRQVLASAHFLWVVWPWHRGGYLHRVIVTCVTCPHLLADIMHQAPSNLIGFIIWSSGDSRWAFPPTYTICSSAAVRLNFSSRSGQETLSTFDGGHSTLISVWSGWSTPLSVNNGPSMPLFGSLCLTWVYIGAPISGIICVLTVVVYQSTRHPGSLTHPLLLFVIVSVVWDCYVPILVVQIGANGAQHHLRHASRRFGFWCWYNVQQHWHTSGNWSH